MSEKRVPIWMDCLAILIAIVACGTTVAVVEGIGHQIYEPFQTDTDPGKDFDQWKKEFGQYIENAPLGSLLTPILAHSIGCVVGGFLACVFRRKFWLTGTLAVGCLFTLVGIGLAVVLPVPLWMIVLDVSIYLPSALLGGTICNAIFAGRRDGTVENDV